MNGGARGTWRVQVVEDTDIKTIRGEKWPGVLGCVCIHACLCACVRVFVCARGEERWHGSKGEIRSFLGTWFWGARGAWLSLRQGRLAAASAPRALSAEPEAKQPSASICVFLGLGGWMGQGTCAPAATMVGLDLGNPRAGRTPAPQPPRAWAPPRAPQPRMLPERPRAGPAFRSRVGGRRGGERAAPFPE